MSSVLELMNYAAPYAGNFIPSVVSLAEALREKGTDAVLVFPSAARGRDWAEQLQAQGLSVYFLPDRIQDRERLLRRIIREHGVTCVHSHFIDRSFYLPLRLCCIGKKIRHVYHAHSTPHFSAHGVGLRRALMHADKTICVSESVRRAFTEYGFTNCVTVPNGVDFSRLSAANAPPPDLPHPLVLLFGYDFHIKGIDTALDAFDELDPAHRYTAGICVAGHGDTAKQALCARYGSVPPWIRLLGPRTDVGAYYRAADVFLSASRTEGMPYAVLEAAYCGLPLVLSDIPPHRELRLPHARLFPAGDRQALFDAIEGASGDTDNANRDYVSQRFSMQRWTQAVAAELLLAQ